MIKRIVLIAILAVLLGCCFIGIKKHHAQSNTEKKFTFWSIQLNEAYKEKMENIISNFKKAHPDYTFVWVDIPIQEAQKRTLASIFEAVDGVGKARSTALIKHFKSLSAIKKASVDDIAEVDGINRALAEKIFEYVKENLI